MSSNSSAGAQISQDNNAREYSMTLPESETQVRQDLAAAYRLLAQFEMDDLTYTHLSARMPDSDEFFIYPFGELFEEVTASSLLRVGMDGTVREGSEFQYNATGYNIHSTIYQARDDVNAIFHLHTPAGVAVSSLKEGLLPLSQFSYHFYDRLAIHEYDSLFLDKERQGGTAVQDLGNLNAMLMRNHGTLTCGTTIQEAFFYAYYLEKACKTQVMILSMDREVMIPPAEVCIKARDDMRGFEPDLGQRDWQALLRRLDTTSPGYKD